MTTRDQILELLPPGGAPVRPQQLAEATGIRAGTVRQTLRRMATAGEVVEDERHGAYRRAERPGDGAAVTMPREAPDPYGQASGSAAPDTGAVVEIVGPAGVIYRLVVSLERVGEPVRVGVRPAD